MLAVVLVVMTFGQMLDPTLVRRICGVALVGWAAWHTTYGHRHRVRFGMTTGLAGLCAWSFLMATAHGAGLMLIPLLGPLGVIDGGHGHHHGDPVTTLGQALGAVAVHGVGMLATTALVAVLVYDWVGVGVLRRGWINLDLVWTAALLAVGVWLLV